MRGISSCCALVALLLAVTWANHHGPHGHHDHHDHHDHRQDADDICHKLSKPNADFGFALYRYLNAKAAAGKNIFFSPLGITSALAMLSAGARGETHRQLFSSMGYGAFDHETVNEAQQHLFKMLGHSQENQNLNVGSAVAMRSGFSPLETFLKEIRDFYDGNAFNVDFAKPAEAAAQINRFIAGKTNNLITDMVKDLDPALALVLINYVYFRGQWEKPFNPDSTTKADFFLDENTPVQVDMMNRLGRYDYYQDEVNHTSVVLLPYKGNTSMMIVLPDPGKMKEVEGYINKDYIEHWHDSVFRNSITLSLPKFSISAEASLVEALKEFGVTDAFSDNADLSGISTEVPLKVSKVSHKAVLKVDEIGTEAAAVTVTEIMPMSMPDTMVINRPFLVFILEHSTKSILFMGKVSDPSGK